MTSLGDGTLDCPPVLPRERWMGTAEVRNTVHGRHTANTDAWPCRDDGDDNNSQRSSFRVESEKRWSDGSDPSDHPVRDLYRGLASAVVDVCRTGLRLSNP